MFRPKVTDRYIREVICYNISIGRNIDYGMLQFEKIDKLPTRPWKHSCLGVGVTQMIPNIIEVEGVPVHYIYCNQCHKVIYGVEQIY